MRVPAHPARACLAALLAVAFTQAPVASASSGFELESARIVHSARDWQLQVPNPYTPTVASDGARLAIAGLGASAGVAPILIMERDADGDWVVARRIEKPSPATNTAFGRSLAISGDRVAASLPGAVAVFARDAGCGGCWGMEQYIVHPDGDTSRFGEGVALDGDLLIVGAPFEFGVAAYDGVAYVYERTGPAGAPWVQRQRIVPGAAAQLFGARIVLTPDQLLIGAPDEFAGGQIGAGTIHVCQRTPPYACMGTVPPAVPQYFGGFGSRFDANGSRLFVGSPNASATGSVDEYQRAGNSYTFTRTYAPAIPQADEQFGDVVAFEGTMLAVGSSRWDSPQGQNVGRVTVFNVPATGAATHFGFMSQNVDSFLSFGNSLAISGNEVIVGGDGRSTSWRPEGASMAYAQGFPEDVRLAAGLSPFGYDVGIAGNELAFPIPSGSGRIEFRAAAGPDSDTPTAVISDPWPATSEYFPSSFETSASTFVATRYINSTGSRRVGVWARTANPAGWVFETELVRDADDLGTLFGDFVDVSEARIAVVSRCTNPLACTDTQLYVFEQPGGPGSAWVRQARLELPPNATTRIAIDGDGLLACSNRCFPFRRSALGIWEAEPELDLGAAAGFAGAVSLVGNLAVVTAPGPEKAAVFRRPQSYGAWTRETIVDAPPQQRNFGTDAATDGEAIVVTSPCFGSCSESDSYANVYYQHLGVWQPPVVLVGSSHGNVEDFGQSVAMSNGRLLVGAPQTADPALGRGAAVAIDYSVALFRDEFED